MHHTLLSSLLAGVMRACPLEALLKCRLAFAAAGGPGPGPPTLAAGNVRAPTSSGGGPLINGPVMGCLVRSRRRSQRRVGRGGRGPGTSVDLGALTLAR